MITILSPAKRMAFDIGPVTQSEPQFLIQARELAGYLRNYEPGPLADVLKTSAALATQAFMDYQDMDMSAPGTAALFAYRGLVFSALDADSFNQGQLDFAQAHLRILSGFYGLLRPLDGIHPYRLEMGHSLPEAGGSLYNYWGDRIARALFAEEDTVLNLASVEYAKAVLPYTPAGGRVITCEFYRMHRGRWKIITTDAKRTRGLMARWILQEAIDRPEDITGFTLEGCRFDRERSEPTIYRFFKD